MKKPDATCIHYDNQSCVKLSENPVFHDKSKHIEIKHHYIRDMVQRGAVKLQYVATEEQIADVLTKPLARVKFEYFREILGVLQIEVPSMSDMSADFHSGNGGTWSVTRNT